MGKVYQTKESLKKMDVSKLKEEVAKDSWVTLKQYFDGLTDSTEAKIAVVVLNVLVKEKQAENNMRAINLAYAKFLGTSEEK